MFLVAFYPQFLECLFFSLACVRVRMCLCFIAIFMPPVALLPIAVVVPPVAAVVPPVAVVVPPVLVLPLDVVELPVIMSPVAVVVLHRRAARCRRCVTCSRAARCCFQSPCWPLPLLCCPWPSSCQLLPFCPLPLSWCLSPSSCRVWFCHEYGDWNLVSARSRRMATGVQKWNSQKKGKEKVLTQGAGTLKGEW